jgi:Cytochrome P460
MTATQQLQNLRPRRQPRNINRDLLKRGRLIRGYIIVIILTLVVLAGYQVKSQNNKSYNQFDLVDKNGIIRKPADYRDRYQALGVFSVVDYNNDTEMHYTYASPGTAENYRKTGKFADGTVLVKEVFASDHAQLTTGDAHWATGTKVWFVMMKDEKGRYPGNPLWGNGRLQLTTRKIAWAATSPQRQQTGSTSRAIQFSAKSKQHDVTGF